MKKISIYLSIVVALMFGSCGDYMSVDSDSNFKDVFVFQSDFEINKVILGVYESVRASSGIHSGGLFYDALSVGSDIELGPEAPSNGGRYSHENCYNANPQLSDMPISSWNSIYNIINTCNIIIEALEKDSISRLNKTTTTDRGHLYGEAVALRATMYYELTRAWGDVIYFTKPNRQKGDYDYANATLVDRNTIQEKEIENLKMVEPMMYSVDISNKARSAERMTKEFVQGLIGRMALLRGGYSLRPASYTGDGDVIQTHTTWGKMVRRSDWKDYYTVANTYLKKLVYGGKVTLTTSDPRTPASKFSNPFQYVFQQTMDYKISSESIFEVSELKGTQSERPYAFGRPSGGGTTGFPPKAYGQVRFFPTFYYGMFNPKDLRRDVTVTATAAGGTANEAMLSFKKGNGLSGGLALNKWDYNRMTDKTYAATQRQTGINAPYMRLDDMILLLAETEAALGNEGPAKTELLKIRQRAFNPSDPEYTSLTSTYVNALSGDALMSAIQDERALELAGEGQRRFDLVRWGILGKKIHQVQTEMDAMIAGLSASGSYTFSNGNVISSYIYTKEITLAKSGLTSILTTTCDVPKTDATYPILYPAWRGTATDWKATTGTTLKNSCLAIKGLFETLSAADVTALTAAGYKKTNWGIDLISDTWKSGLGGIFGGYLLSDFESNFPPRYILAIPATSIIYSKNVKNSYGFPNQ